MHKLCLFAMIIGSILSLMLFMQPAHAISPSVVISQIKAGNSSTSRLVEIFNNSNSSVDITGWCLQYSSPSNASLTSLGCFASLDTSIHIVINSGSYALLASSQTGLSADILLIDGLGAGTSGHVYLFDNVGNEVDRVGWGTAVNAETTPIALDSTKVIERRRDEMSKMLVDTDNNGTDFVVSTLRAEYKYGEIYEVVDKCMNMAGIQEFVPNGYTINSIGDCKPEPIDVCINLDGSQIVVPVGYALDENQECKVDVCLNIDGLQQILPNGFELNESGACVAHDECSNLPDIQVVIPDGYKRGVENICLLDLLPIEITEMLPNAVGVDENNEFIELYNQNDSDIDLANYVLSVGVSDDQFNFPMDSIIYAGRYKTFSDNDINYTLVNTTGKVMLRSVDDQLIDETPIYESPNDGLAWALINHVWQYTNRPTPGSANLASLFESDELVVAESILEPCAANQYRSPETNRCRLIATISVSALVPCKDGQYRSEDTNRCRNIVSDVIVLVPCDEGQERNPATNRCRAVTSILGASDLVPCKEGQERNPDTNRCRNVVSVMPLVEYKPEQTNSSANNYVLWWSLAAVLFVAIIYGIWEWRNEVVGLFRKIKMKVVRDG